jgi:glycyl-tRNA synthetase alpha subunit
MPLNFQQVILALQQFWAEPAVPQGDAMCFWQPYNTQVGAGTREPQMKSP